MVACGVIYRTPIPVQPMKAAGAIATTQAAQTLIITPSMVWGASLATGIVWLLLGLTGTANRVARLVSRPVVIGIILGLGFGFMIEGAKMMSQNWWVGWSGLARHLAAAHQPGHSGDVPAAACSVPPTGLISDHHACRCLARGACGDATSRRSRYEALSHSMIS